MSTAVLTGLASFVGGMLGSTLVLYGPALWGRYGPARCIVCGKRRLRRPSVAGWRQCKVCNSETLYQLK
jgi:hypothetical protein